MEAHIVAKRKGGPRADPSMPKHELDRYENLILLCPTHHYAVVDAEPQKWTVDKLRAMKAQHEEDIARRLAQSHGRMITLGDPVEYPNEYCDRTNGEHVTYRLFRVPIVSRGADAEGVFVQLLEPRLQKGLPSPMLHLAGDNPSDHRSFQDSSGFDLSDGVPRHIDVIAITKNPPYRCFIFSNASDDAMEEHDELEGEYTFRLGAFGGGTQDYAVEVDLKHGMLSMAKGGEDFWLEPGAPMFRVNPGLDEPTAETIKLLMTFTQTAGDEVTPVIEWSGANAEPSRPLMMPENQRPGARYQKYQLKPALARPSLPSDEVTFDIRFRWHGATRRYRWRWPLYMREKGIWGMNNVAENTLEPKECTTVD